MRAFRKSISLACLFLSFCLWPSFPSHSDIPLGERLEYQITWLRIPVGIGEVWAKEKIMLGGREVIHVVGTIRTNKILSKIFPIFDEAQSWIDAETFESLQFEKKVDELFLNGHEKMVFDPIRKKRIFSVV